MKKQGVICYNWALRWQRHWFGWRLRKTGLDLRYNGDTLQMDRLDESWSWLFFTFAIHADRIKGEKTNEKSKER